MDNNYVDNLVKARGRKKKAFNLQEELRKLEALEKGVGKLDEEELKDEEGEMEMRELLRKKKR